MFEQHLNGNNALPTFGGILLACLAVFFIMREVMCWYYKINKQISLQEKQIALLEQLVKNSGGFEIKNTPEQK
jgi:hypothetical protein